MEKEQRIALYAGLFFVALIAAILLFFHSIDRMKIQKNNLNSIPESIPIVKNIPVQSEKQQTMVDPFKDIKISDFKDWKTYSNNEYGIEIKYPEELSIEKGEAIVFNFLKADNSSRKLEGSILTTFKISMEKYPLSEVLRKRGIDNLLSPKQEKIKLNGVSVEKLTYQDAFSGNNFYEIYIPNGSNTIIVWYAGNNPLELTFSKMLSTLERL
ncbi:MAG: hypothetical protein ABI747_03560 [Candidatus Moraniibacteriota bacterium]